jgi:hypothetical protein
MTKQRLGVSVYVKRGGDISGRLTDLPFRACGLIHHRLGLTFPTNGGRGKGLIKARLERIGAEKA